MEILTIEQVLALAPEAESVKEGQSFANPFLRLIEAFFVLL
jgi:hypothetical protein